MLYMYVIYKYIIMYMDICKYIIMYMDICQTFLFYLLGLAIIASLNTWLPHRICKWDDVQMKQLENVQVQCRHEGWWHRSLEHPIFGCCPAEFHFTFCACSLVGPPHSSMLQLRTWFFYPNLVVAWGSEVVPRFWHHQNCLSWVYACWYTISWFFHPKKLPMNHYVQARNAQATRYSAMMCDSLQVAAFAPLHLQSGPFLSQFIPSGNLTWLWKSCIHL
jgi:hypothetical protein